MKNKLLTTIQESKSNLRNTKCLCIASLMSALGCIMHIFFRIPIIPNMLYVSFSYIALVINGYLCGPIVGAIVGGVTDIVGFLIRPDGDFFIGFVLNEVLMGFVLGCIFYKQKQITLKKCLCASIFNALVINTILTPLWLYIMYGNALFPVIWARLIKNIILLPIETILLMVILKAVTRLKIQIK